MVFTAAGHTPRYPVFMEHFPMSKVPELKKQFESNDWKARLKASDELAAVGTEESLNFLRDQLESEDNWIRNAAVLGLMETRKQKFLKPIIDRISELGFHEEIGTMVYALVNFDCSNELLFICKLYLNGNAEVRMATSSILAEQKFRVTEDELLSVQQLLNERELKMEYFKIKYELIGK